MDMMLDGQTEAQRAFTTLNKSLLAAKLPAHHFGPHQGEGNTSSRITALIKCYGGQGKCGTRLLGLSHFFIENCSALAPWPVVIPPKFLPAVVRK